jgi:pimeloyl-ACP methyl ester carboxylesterase
VTSIRHGRVSIALHELRAAPGPTLLCLHALGGSAADFRSAAGLWPGRVVALDFAGHGGSDPLRGGGYYPEILAGDADAVLAHTGAAHLLGAGVGAYVALLLAGGRPDLVPAALLLPGAGLDGGGVAPDHATDTERRWTDLAPPLPGCDPAVRRLERDLRPPDYAIAFALAARRLLLAEDGASRPAWWHAAQRSPAAARAPVDLARALALLAE